MSTAALLKPNTYRDSVALMVLSTALAEADGVLQASAMMATPANLEILRATGLFAARFGRVAGGSERVTRLPGGSGDGGWPEAPLARPRA